MKYRIGDIIKLQDGTFGRLFQRVDDKIWKVQISSEIKNLSEETFLKFDKSETISAIRISLKEVDWTKLESKSTNCVECKQLIQFLKNLSQYGELT